MADGFGSQGFGGGFGSKGFGSTEIGGLNNSINLDSVTGLEELATAYGWKDSKVINALDKAGRILNMGTATVAGSVRGALRGEGILKGAREGLKENIGFSEVYREFAGKPETRLGKVAVGIGGFAADVLFDPLTYLTLGTSAGLKVGGKTLTKGASKMSQEVSKNVLESTRDKLVQEGFSMGQAKRMSQTVDNRKTNDLFSRAVSKKGITADQVSKMATTRLSEQLGRDLTVKEADDFLTRAINTRDIDVILNSGTKLIDEGGIKYFGKTCGS